MDLTRIPSLGPGECGASACDVLWERGLQKGVYTWCASSQERSKLPYLWWCSHSLQNGRWHSAIHVPRNMKFHHLLTFYLLALHAKTFRNAIQNGNLFMIVPCLITLDTFCMHLELFCEARPIAAWKPWNCDFFCQVTPLDQGLPEARIKMELWVPWRERVRSFSFLRTCWALPNAKPAQLEIMEPRWWRLDREYTGFVKHLVSFKMCIYIYLLYTYIFI